MNEPKEEPSVSEQLGAGQNEFLGDTLLSQYKRCNQINDQQLRKAKNIKDLVNINVAAIDKQLYVSGERRRRPLPHTSSGARSSQSQPPGYNLAFDPVVFRQRVPCMGNRNFLVNQAILMNSTEASLGSSGIHPQQPPKRRARNMRHHTQAYKRRSPPKLNSNHQSPPKEDLTQNEELHLVKMGHGSQLDPVKNLQSLFQKKQYIERKPYKNFLAEKYRGQRRRNFQSGNFESELLVSPSEASRVAGFLQGQNEAFGSTFSPDFSSQIGPTSKQAFSPCETGQVQSVERVASTAPVSQISEGGNYFTGLNRDIASAQEAGDRQVQRARVVTPETDLTETHRRIRDKLTEMKHLFEEDEEKHLLQKNSQAKGGRGRLNGLLSQTGANHPENWNDAHGHKIMYEEAMDRRKNQLKRIQADKKKELAQGTLSDARAQGFNEDELKQFLTDRISNLREKTFGKNRELDALNDPQRFRFKASTIANVLPRGVLTEHSKLQQNYKTRYSTNGATFLQKRGSAGQQRSLSRKQSDLRKSTQRKSTQFKKQRVEQLSHRDNVQASSDQFLSQTDLVNQFAASPHTNSPSQSHSTDSNKPHSQLKLDSVDSHDLNPKTSPDSKVLTQPLVSANASPAPPKGQPDQSSANSKGQGSVQLQTEKERGKVNPSLIAITDHELKSALLVLPSPIEGVPEDELSVTRDKLLGQIRDKQAEQLQDQSLTVSALSGIQDKTQQPKFDLNVTQNTQKGQRLPAAHSPPKDQNLNISITKNTQQSNLEPDTLEPRDGDTTLEQRSHCAKTLGQQRKELVQKQAHSLESDQFLSEIEDQLQASALPLPQQPDTQHQNNLLMGMHEIQQQFDAPQVGAQLAFFSPRRFKRYPNFAIFFKDKQAQNLQTQFEEKNTVSLNSDFLKFLIDKRHIQTAINANENPQKSANLNLQPNVVPHSESNPNLPKHYQNLSSKERKKEIMLPKVPSDVVQWNEYLKKKRFDPFEQVLLVKGIDNQILTSYRTLKGENNTVTDTFKIVHKKFAPPKNSNAFFKQMILHQIDKIPYQTNYQQTSPTESTHNLNPADPDFLDQNTVTLTQQQPNPTRQVFNQKIPTAVNSPVDRSDIFDNQNADPPRTTTEVQIQLKPKVKLPKRNKKENEDIPPFSLQEKPQVMLESSPVQLDDRSFLASENKQPSISKKINIGIPFSQQSKPQTESQPKIQAMPSQRRIITVPKPIVPANRFLQRQCTSNLMNSPDVVISPNAKLGGIQGRSPLRVNPNTNLGEEKESGKKKQVGGDQAKRKGQFVVHQQQQPGQSAVTNPLMEASVYKVRDEEFFGIKQEERSETVNSPLTRPLQHFLASKTRNVTHLANPVSTKAREDLSVNSTVKARGDYGNVVLLSEHEVSPQQDFMDLQANATFVGSQMNSTLKGKTFLEMLDKETADKLALEGVKEEVTTRGSLKRPRTKHSEKQVLSIRSGLLDPKNMYSMKVSVLKSNVRAENAESETNKQHENKSNTPPPLQVTNSVQLPSQSQEDPALTSSHDQRVTSQIGADLAQVTSLGNKKQLETADSSHREQPVVKDKAIAQVTWTNSASFMKKAVRSPEGKKAPKLMPASLKVPLSLVNTVDAFSFSNLFSGPHKGKMSVLANEIYAHDRKLISNAQLGNKLTSNVLNLAKFHKLKSSTGVERHDYELKVIADIVDSQQPHSDLCLQATAPLEPKHEPHSPFADAHSQTKQQAVIDLPLAGAIASNTSVDCTGYQDVVAGRQRKGTELIRRSMDSPDQRPAQKLSGTLGDTKTTNLISIQADAVTAHPPNIYAEKIETQRQEN